MAKVGITETILRDAHQSLIATRMSTEEMLPALEALDKIGYRSLECWGGVLGMCFFSVRRRSHGSSSKKRRQASNVAPPQHSSER